MKKIKKATRRLSAILAIILAFSAFTTLPVQARVITPSPSPSIQTSRIVPVIGEIEIYNLTDSCYVKHDPLKANKSYELIYSIDVDRRVRDLEFYAAQLPNYLYKGQDLTLGLETYGTVGKATYARTKEVTLYSEENLYLRTSVTARTDIRKYAWYEPQLWDDSTRSYKTYYNFYKSGATPAERYYEVHVRIDAFKI